MSIEFRVLKCYKTNVLVYFKHMSGLYFQGGKLLYKSCLKLKKKKIYIYIYIYICQLNRKPANNYVPKERYLFHKRM